jgi:hypothetical protein
LFWFIIVEASRQRFALRRNARTVTGHQQVIVHHHHHHWLQAATNAQDRQTPRGRGNTAEYPAHHRMF